MLLCLWNGQTSLSCVSYIPAVFVVKHKFLYELGIVQWVSPCLAATNVDQGQKSSVHNMKLIFPLEEWLANLFLGISVLKVMYSQLFFWNWAVPKAPLNPCHFSSHTHFLHYGNFPVTQLWISVASELIQGAWGYRYLLLLGTFPRKGSIQTTGFWTLSEGSCLVPLLLVL